MSQQSQTRKPFFLSWEILRWIVIPGVWVLVAILAPLLAQRNFMAVALVGRVGALFGAYALLRWPGLGFPALMVAILIVPFRINTGTMTSINIALLMVAAMIGLWILEMVGRDRLVRLVKTGVILPSLLFTLVAILAFLYGQLNWFPTRPASIFAQLGGLFLFIFSIGTLIVTVHRLQEVRWLQVALWAFIILSTAYNLFFLFPPTRFYANRFFQRVVNESLFWTWFCVASFGMAYLNTKLAPKWRVVCGIIAALAFYNLMILKQNWTSGWFPAAIALFTIVLLTRPKWAIWIGIVAVVFALVGTDFVNELLLGGDNEYSMVTRLEAWKILGQIIMLNPLFGLGPANYYFYTPFYDILGYSVSFNSHNNYIDIVAQVGLLGLGLFLWIFWEVLRSGWRMRKIAREGFDRAYVYLAIGGTVGTLAAGMLGDWIVPFVYNVGMEGFRSAALGWFFMGGLVFLEVAYRRNQEDNLLSND